MKWIGLIFASLGRKPVRTALTGASLAIAFLMFGLLQPVVQLFDGDIARSDVSRLVVSPKHSISDMLPLRYVNDVAALDGVDTVAHQTWFGGIFKDPQNIFSRWAVSAESFLAVAPGILLTDEERKAFINTRTAAIVGRKTADKFGLHVGDKVPLTADIWHNKDGSSWTFDLVGIFEGANSTVDTTTMYINFEFFDEYRIVAPGFISNLLVTVDDPAELDAVAQAIDANFGNSQMETRTISEEQYRLQLARQLGNIGLIVRGILGAVFFTILLLTANTMSQATRERTAELAVLKTLGFQNHVVFGIVLAEALLMTVVAAGLGLILATVLLQHADSLSSQIPNLRLTEDTLVMGLVLAIVVGAGTGLAPAMRAMRLSIVDALQRA